MAIQNNGYTADNNLVNSNGLYTVNRWNKPFAMQNLNKGYYDTSQRLFNTALNTSLNDNNFSINGDRFSLSNPKGIINTPQLSKPNIQMPQGSKAGSGAGWAAAGQAAASSLLNTPAGDKALDVMDPVWHLAGGRESEVGNSLSTAGKETFKAGAASGNGYVMLAGAALKVGGGLYNALNGIKTDKEALKAANAGIDYYNNYRSDASSFDDIEAPLYMAFNNPYKGGVFSKGKAKRMNQDLRDTFNEKESYAYRGYENNIHNIANTQMSSLLKDYNVEAFGGPLESLGAVNYGFMQDYLKAKNKAADAKDKISTNVFGSLPVTPMSTFALGGDIQTNGTDFTTGLTKIDAGGTHEQNPYQGVQVGISRGNGNPNLVEEGETIFDDYVFSRRIKVDNKTKKRFHLGKNAKMSYADLSKKLEKESLERPNDPISQNGLTRQLHELAEQQERQKAEQEEKEAQRIFNSLPIEQQRMIMQQVAEEQQAQQMQQQPTEEIQGQQEQQVPQQMMEAQQIQQPQMQEGPQAEMSACGGRLNRFDKGGDMKQKIYKYLGMVSDADFDKWATDNRVDKITNWENILKNEQFMDALRRKAPDLYDVINRGYDFGEYKASTNGYNWNDFIKTLDAYKKSKIAGNTDKHYAADDKFSVGNYKDIKDYEGSQQYKAYSDYMKDVINRTKEIGFKYGDNAHSYDKVIWKDPNRRISKEDFDALNVLSHTIQGTSVTPDKKPVPMLSTDSDGYTSLVSNADTLFNQYRTDGIGGIFHLNPEMRNPENLSENYEVGKDGQLYKMYNVPKDWVKVNSYNWADPNGNKTITYYKRPEEEDSEDAKNPTPKHLPTWGRYVSAMGPGLGLAMQLSGYGKPNYSALDRAAGIANTPPTLTHFTPSGTKLRLDPFDLTWQQDILSANSRATDRAILNNSTPTGTKMAGVLANGYNSQLQNGELYKKALEYENARRTQELGFNNAIDSANAQGADRAAAANASIINNYNQARAQMNMAAAREKLDTDASWYRGIYGNMDNIFKSIGNWGKENQQHNMIADMAADSLFGVLGNRQNISRGYFKSRGGRLRRKKK